MSNNAGSVLSVARGELGYSRWNDPKAGTKYGRWYAQQTGESYYGTSGVPYCAMFVSWVFAHAGAKCVGIPGAYCPYIERDARRAGKTVSKSSAKPGDVVLFDWGGDGVCDHVGIVESNHGSYMTTIEGNTSNGIVARRTRAYGSIRCIVRPSYGGSKPSNVSKPSGNGKLAVDGYWGSNTTRLAQKIAGTTIDGVISSQDSTWRGRMPGCTSGWEWTSHAKGSKFWTWFQRNVLHTKADGICGPNDINAFIRKYGNGITDGRLDAPSTAIKGFQKCLNKGHF